MNALGIKRARGTMMPSESQCCLKTTLSVLSVGLEKTAGKAHAARDSVSAHIQADIRPSPSTITKSTWDTDAARYAGPSVKLACKIARLIAGGVVTSALPPTGGFTISSKRVAQSSNPRRFSSR
jgi:hypothetical protein